MKRMGFILVLAMMVTLTCQQAQSQEQKEKKMPKPEKMKEMMMEKGHMMKEMKGLKVEEMKPFKYCALEMTGSYDQHEAAFEKLYEEAGKQDLPMDAAPLGIYLNDPETTPEEELEWEVGFKISGDTDIQPPLVIKKWEYPLVATMRYEGPFDEEVMGPMYFRMFKWISMNNYTPVGPMAEKYMGMPRKNEKGQLSGNVMIMVPVEKQTEEPDVPDPEVPEEPEMEEEPEM